MPRRTIPVHPAAGALAALLLPLALGGCLNVNGPLEKLLNLGLDSRVSLGAKP